MEQAPQPRLGDLIEISREGFQHWAVFIGNGKVVHLTTSDGICNSPGTRRGEVKKEPLTEVVGDCQYKVCNMQDAWAAPYQPEQIAKRAWACVGKTMTYSCDKYNCEHFAIEMRFWKNDIQRLPPHLSVFTAITLAVVWLIKKLG